MKGQVFTIAKLHYVNGVVYFIARANSTSLDALAENAIETTKSGTAKDLDRTHAPIILILFIYEIILIIILSLLTKIIK